MDESGIVGSFAALAHEHRLRIFRLLVRAGPSGMAAGDIAGAIGISATNTSFHLKELDRAGLLRATRDGRYIRYAVHVEGMRRLLTYLTEDCCDGRPEICGGIFAAPAICDTGLGESEMVDRAYNVLFLCTHNSARSVIAECVMNRLGRGRFAAYSAGSQPSGRVHPLALELLAKLNYDTAGLRSKSWEEFARPDAPALDFVFTVCDDAAEEVCPVWPGQPMTAHWGLPDPSRAEGTPAERALAFADTHRMLNQRISIFCNLPLASLDRLSLQKDLDAIGKGRFPAPAR